MSIVRHQAREDSFRLPSRRTAWSMSPAPSPDTRPASVKAQTEEILGRIDALLAHAGSDKAKIVSATIWLGDIRFRDEMNEAWLAWVDCEQPAGARLRRSQARDRGHAGRDRGDRCEIR